MESSLPKIFIKNINYPLSSSCFEGCSTTAKTVFPVLYANIAGQSVPAFIRVCPETQVRGSEPTTCAVVFVTTTVSVFSDFSFNSVISG